MTLDSDTLLALMDTELLHCSEVFVTATADELLVQIPADEPTVPLTLRQRHDVQPDVVRADAAQQHLPRHRLLPQSKDDEHGSPGLDRWQEPKEGVQEEQPSEADALEQQ